MNLPEISFVVVLIAGFTIMRTVMWLQAKNRFNEALFVAVLGCVIAAGFTYMLTKDFFWTLCIAALIFIIQGGVHLVKAVKMRRPKNS